MNLALSKMDLAVFLNLGSSIGVLERTGQLPRFLKHLEFYARFFETVFLLTYHRETWKSPKAQYRLLPAPGVHRYLYMFLMPLVFSQELQSVSVYRAMQVGGAIPAVIGKQLYHKPLLVTYGYEWHRWITFGRGRAIGHLVRLFEQLCLRRADCILVYTEALKQQVLRYGVDEAKVVILPPWVDTDLFRPSRPKAARPFLVVGYVGRLAPEKNLEALVRAVAGLREVRLLLVGDGSQHTALARLAEELGVQVEFAGVIPNDRLPYFLSQMDIYVQPSFLESFGKSILEAMACGLPVIAARAEGPLAILSDGETGLLCDGTPEEIRERILFLATAPLERARMGEAARHFVDERYSPYQVLTAEMELLLQLARKKATEITQP